MKVSDLSVLHQNQWVRFAGALGGLGMLIGATQPAWSADTPPAGAGTPPPGVATPASAGSSCQVVIRPDLTLTSVESCQAKSCIGVSCGTGAANQVGFVKGGMTADGISLRVYDAPPKFKDVVLKRGSSGNSNLNLAQIFSTLASAGDSTQCKAIGSGALAGWQQLDKDGKASAPDFTALCNGIKSVRLTSFVVASGADLKVYTDSGMDGGPGSVLVDASHPAQKPTKLCNASKFDDELEMPVKRIIKVTANDCNKEVCVLWGACGAVGPQGADDSESHGLVTCDKEPGKDCPSFNQCYQTGYASSSNGSGQ